MTQFSSHTVSLPALRLRCAAACMLVALVASIPFASAVADGSETEPEANALQQQVERTAVAYDEALATLSAADEALGDNNARIRELEELIPVQQARSDAAARELYKFQQQSTGVIDLVLSADSFYDFMANLEYVNRITSANASEIARLNDLKAELASEREALEQARAEADEHALQAERALTAAQEARLEAQRQAQEAARQAAEADAAARAAASAATATPTAAPDGAAEPTPAASAQMEAAEEAVSVIDDGANWASEESTFVESWAGRIDAYLSGSPLSGQGRTFAQAAWDYGVDPRWSPAIAYTESSLGAACFLPHNAWGWGSSSWGSWEEAINDHVRGLARGYGYTISMEAAQKYCPPSAQHWYDTTLGQMNLI